MSKVVRSSEKVKASQVATVVPPELIPPQNMVKSPTVKADARSRPTERVAPR